MIITENMQKTNEADDVKTLNETIIRTANSLDPSIANSIYYPKLKHLTFREIVDFCKEKLELKADLLELNDFMGMKISEEELRNYLDNLKLKYGMIDNIGLEYHIESTKVDYGVSLFVVIRRADIDVKKFVFRFRKSATDTIFGLGSGGATDPANVNRSNYYDSIIDSI